MPNLTQLISLKEQFGSLTFEERQTKEFIERSRIKANSTKKAFSLNERQQLEEFDLAKTRPDLIDYFEKSPTEEVVLLFIDITGFSKIMENHTSSQLQSYLTTYYSTIIAIIYKHQGQIEKIMGDGIVCVFGRPFL